MNKYRVWHSAGRYCTKVKGIITANSGKEARLIVKDMFPGHKVSSCWLIEKGG